MLDWLPLLTILVGTDMALKFTGRHYHDDQTGTVTFPAWHGQARVTCRITDEALMFIFGAARTDTGLLEAFDKHKASIELAAACKFEASAGATSITLASRDFPDKTPAAGSGSPGHMPEGREPRRAGTQNVAAKVEQFRRHARDRDSANAIDPDIAAWNAETEALLGKLDADILAAEESEEEAGDGTKP